MAKAFESLTRFNFSVEVKRYDLLGVFIFTETMPSWVYPGRYIPVNNNLGVTYLHRGNLGFGNAQNGTGCKHLGTLASK
jgi:hypothetical protein